MTKLSKKIIGIFGGAAALATLGGCTDAGKAQRTLESAGYTNIKAGGYAVWGCGEDDDFHTKFKATNPAGKEVEGVVCSGWFKGGTIRFN